jgi:hypothetical protein
VPAAAIQAARSDLTFLLCLLLVLGFGVSAAISGASPERILLTAMAWLAGTLLLGAGLRVALTDSGLSFDGTIWPWYAVPHTIRGTCGVLIGTVGVLVLFVGGKALHQNLEQAIASTVPLSVFSPAVFSVVYFPLHWLGERLATFRVQ